MNDEMKIAYTLGLIDGTLGSPRNYTKEDYRRRLQMAAAALRGDRGELLELTQEDLLRQNILDRELGRSA